MEYFVFCDTETGGLNAGQPVLQMSWHVVASGDLTVKRENFYFMPESWDNVDENALRVNRLWPDKLAEKVQEQGVISFLDASHKLIDDLRNYKAAFVAYNAPYDVAMILGMLSGVNARSLKSLLSGKNVIDVMKPSREFLKIERWLKLVNAYEEITGNKPREDAHEANADIEMTREVFFKLAEFGRI